MAAKYAGAFEILMRAQLQDAHMQIERNARIKSKYTKPNMQNQISQTKHAKARDPAQ
ncbi:MAG: hypothetical protein OD918_02415 [Gammaproteobacteria bacterium]